MCFSNFSKIGLVHFEVANEYIFAKNAGPGLNQLLDQENKPWQIVAYFGCKCRPNNDYCIYVLYVCVMYIILRKKSYVNHIWSEQYLTYVSLHRQCNVYQPIPSATSQPHSDIPVFSFAEFTTENESSAATNVEFPYNSIDSAPKVFRTYTIPQTRLPVRGPWDSFGLTLKLESNWIKLEHIPMHYTSHVARELVQCR